MVAALNHASNEFHEAHKPDNGFMSSALDVVTY